MRLAADRLSVRWFIGYDLHEPLPDHSNLTRTRERFGLSVFRRFLEEIIERCVEEGLVRGDELFFDSTKVEGDADVNSLAPRWAVEAHLNKLFEEETLEKGGPSAAGRPAATVALPTSEEAALREKNAAGRDWISRDGAQDRSFAGYRKRTSDSRASTIDPDATPMPPGPGQAGPKARLPGPLCGRRRQGEGYPQRPRRPRRGHREPPHARPLVAHLLPLEDPASPPRHRRRQVRYPGKRSGSGGSGLPPPRPRE